MTCSGQFPSPGTWPIAPEASVLSLMWIEDLSRNVIDISMELSG